jgi:hypothetical protein
VLNWALSKYSWQSTVCISESSQIAANKLANPEVDAPATISLRPALPFCVVYIVASLLVNGWLLDALTSDGKYIITGEGRRSTSLEEIQ